MKSQPVFYFFQLDPVPPDFNLVIDPSQEFDITIRQPPGQVAGAVYRKIRI